MLNKSLGPQGHGGGDNNDIDQILSGLKPYEEVFK